MYHATRVRTPHCGTLVQVVSGLFVARTYPAWYTTGDDSVVMVQQGALMRNPQLHIFRFCACLSRKRLVGTTSWFLSNVAAGLPRYKECRMDPYQAIPASLQGLHNELMRIIQVHRYRKLGFLLWLLICRFSVVLLVFKSKK